MLVNPLAGIAKILKRNPIPRLRRLKRSLHKARGTQVSQHLSNWWLQMRFGIMPFLNDISAIHAECSRKAFRESPIMHSRAVNRQGPIQERESYTGVMFSAPVWGDIYSRSQQRTTATVYYNRLQWTHKERYGLDWSQVPSVMWELVPFSFLVDRVVNVGEWLEVMRPKQGFSILGSTVSYRESVERVFHAKEIGITSPSNVRTSTDHACRTCCELYRRTIPGPLPSGPVVNLNISGLVKTLDHLTLLNQNVLKRIMR